MYANNCHQFKDIKQYLNDYDVVINTIPDVLFDENDEKYFCEGAVLFELASKKCFEANNTTKVKYVLCPALPSKYTPKSAADLIINKIEKILKEKKL